MNNATDYDELDTQERAGFYAPSRACINCGATSNLCDIWPDDEPKSVLACDDCCAEIRRVEAIADQLAALPCCDVRQALIDQTTATAALVNVLTAHDRTCGCSKRKPIAAETCPYCHSGSLGSIGPLAECRNCHQVWNPAIAEVS